MKLTLAITFLAGFVLGGLLLAVTNPYNRCTVEKGFTNPEDIGECIWLLENQPALR